MQLDSFITQEQHSVKMTGIEPGQWVAARYFGGEPYVVLQCKSVTRHGKDYGAVIPEDVGTRHFRPVNAMSSYLLDLNYKPDQLLALQERSIKEYDAWHRTAAHTRLHPKAMGAALDVFKESKDAKR